MSQSIPSASWWENLRFLVGHFLPYYLQGIFLRCPKTTGLLASLGVHPFHPAFFAELRDRHGSDLIYLRLLGRRMLVTLDPRHVRQVLEHSPRIYAEPDSKRTGMGHFQPHAVTVSRGSSWEKRRAANEEALQTDSPIHGQAGRLLQRIHGALPEAPPEDWTDFATLFRRIAQLLVFGRIDTGTSGAVDDLLRLMGEANRLFLLKPSPRQAALEGLIRAHLAHPEPGSLLSMLPEPPHDPALQAAGQVPHWLFALADTLPMNVIRALLLILSFPDTRQTVMREIDSVDTTRPEGIAGLHVLSGCLQEAMRLWPTTPVIGRVMIARDRIGGVEVPPATEVLIINNVLHRDERLSADANRFRPERWEQGTPPYLFNHLSNGTQGCAGRHLALFVGTAVLALLLQRWRFSSPTSQIHPAAPIPLINNHFAIHFSATPRVAEATATS